MYNNLFITEHQIEFAENILNANPYETWEKMFYDRNGMDITLSVQGIAINKYKFVIVNVDLGWKIIPCCNEEDCLNINILNHAIICGRHLSIDERYGEIRPVARIYDDNGNCIREFPFVNMEIIDSPRGKFCIPIPPLATINTIRIFNHNTFIRGYFDPTGIRGVSGNDPGHIDTVDIDIGYVSAYATGRFRNLRTEDDFMFTNNLNNKIITNDGKLIIDTNGIKYEDLRGNNVETIATTEDMLKIYGNDVIRKLWNYVNSPVQSMAEAVIKNQIKKILLEGDEN